MHSIKSILSLALVLSAGHCKQPPPPVPDASGGSPPVANAAGGGGSIVPPAGTGGQSASGGSPPSATCEASVRTEMVRREAIRRARSFDKRLERYVSPRIVGGKDSVLPWAVAISSNGMMSGQYCGGTLIEDTWVLTAAHCKVEPGDQVIGGRANLSTVPSGHAVKVTKVLEHADYEDATTGNDISLLQLEKKPLGAEVVPLTSVRPADGSKTSAIGWGLLTENGQPSPKQQKVDNLPVVANSTCSTANGIAIDDTMLCAGIVGKDSCQGDSGGPLAREVSAGKWEQVGIVSWGIGCGRDGVYGVYTNLAKYSDWVTACTN